MLRIDGENARVDVTHFAFPDIYSRNRDIIEFSNVLNEKSVIYKLFNIIRYDFDEDAMSYHP